MKKQDYMITLIVSGIIMICYFALFKLSSFFFGQIGFSEFAIVRRVIGFLSLVFAFGMGVGITRETARLEHSAVSHHKYLLLRFSITAMLLISALFTLILWLYPDFFARLIFSDVTYANLLLPMNIAMIATLLTSFTSSYFRGLNRIYAFNGILLINTGIAPLIVICLSKSISMFFLIFGFSTFLINIIFIAPDLIKSLKIWDKKLIIQFTSFSLSRLPADIFFQLLFVIPPIIAAHLAGVLLAGKISFALSLLYLITAPLGPLSILILPHSIKVLKTQDKKHIKKFVQNIMSIVLAASVSFSLCLFFAAHLISVFFMKTHGNDGAFVIKGIAIASVPFALYFVFRAIVDAGERIPYNSFNAFISFVTLCSSTFILSYFLRAQDNIVLSTILCFSVLGALTLQRVILIVRKNAGVR